MKSKTTQDSPGFGIFAKLSLLFIALMALAVTAQAGDGKGNNGNPGVLPPQANAYGQSYGEWAAEWWQWVWSIPADQNPLLDTTGEFAAVGQEGNVWFLAGDIGGTVVRDVTIPAGKALFFPIINQSWIQFPTDPPMTIEEIRALLAWFADCFTDLACEIDGTPVENLQNYRVQSPVFSAVLPEGNIYGQDPGLFTPCVDDGYYLMVAPLPVGEHTIHFHGATSAWAADTIVLDVTYNLTVAPARK